MLLVHNASDFSSRFSHYLRELLFLEGFLAIEEIDVIDLPTRLAQSPDETILLARMNLSAAMTDAIVSHIHQGGRLIALHPDHLLLSRLNCTPAFAAIRKGFMSFTECALLAGLPLDPVQVVVPTVRWSASTGATTLATMVDVDDPATQTAAISQLRVGNGEAVLIGFDLARAVIRLRFGDPALDDLYMRSNDNNLRPHELLIGTLDPRQMRIAQTDILTAILGRMVETFDPQPRVWYYPRPDQRSALIQTSDDDWSTIEQFEVMLGVLEQYDATATFYIVPNSNVTTSHLDRWEQAGHTFSVHPASDSEAHHGSPPEEPQALWVPDMVRRNIERHRAQYGRDVITIRNHAIRWAHYLEVPRIHADYGVRAEANYFCVPPFPVGFLCGSGRPAPFVEETGTILDHYQIPSAWTEEVLLHPTHSASMNWMAGKAQLETNAIIQRAAQRYFTPVTVNSHPVSFATYSRPVIEDNWRQARELDVPIVGADHWMTWVDARRGLKLAHTGDQWTLQSDRDVPSVTVLFPQAASAEGGITTIEQIWGRTYHAVLLSGLTKGQQRRISTTPLSEGRSL